MLFVVLTTCMGDHLCILQCLEKCLDNQLCFFFLQCLVKPEAVERSVAVLGSSRLLCRMCPLLAPAGQEELLPVADNVEYLNRLKIHKHFVIFRTFLLKSAEVLD